MFSRPNVGCHNFGTFTLKANIIMQHHEVLYRYRL